MEKIEQYYDIIVQNIITYGPKLILSILTLWIGLKIIKGLVKVTERNMGKSNLDKTLIKFVSNLLSWGLKIMLFVSCASMVGIETTSFVAVLGAAGLAIGLALQGALANFAGGVLLMVFKPYKVGDVISAQGETGGVKEIQIFTTVLLNPDNETIIIPNGAVVGGNIKNLSKEGKIRLNIAIGISYGASIKDARDVLLEVMNSHELVLNNPEPSVTVVELADSSVNLMVRPWCDPVDYWTVLGDIIEQGKLALDENKIEIPFPQMDVHLEKVN